MDSSKYILEAKNFEPIDTTNLNFDNCLFVNRAFLYLYLDKEQLVKGYIFSLKQYLLSLLNSLKKTLIISVVFSEEVLKEYDLINNVHEVQQILSFIYNIFEPEYSKHYSIITVTILLPQIFENPVIPDLMKFDVFLYDNDVISLTEFKEIVITSSELEYRFIKHIRTMQSVPEFVPEDTTSINLEEPLINIDISKQDMSKFQFKMTCLGGSFDHLHLGHKLLLT